MNNARYLIVLWISGNCNLSCKYCYAHEKCSENMNFETAKAILDKMKNYPLTIQFAGGEPMLNFDLIEKICEYIKENSIDAVLQMQSNGTLINEYNARKIKELKIAIGISLDGKKAINEQVRGATNKVLQGIMELRNQAVMINLNAVVTKYNVEHLDELIDLSLWLGNVGGIGLDLLRNAGSAINCFENLQITKEQLVNGLKKMHERANEIENLSGKKIGIREIEKAKKRLGKNTKSENYCYASIAHSIVVLPNGKLYPCGSLINEKYFMGTATDFSLENVKCTSCKKPTKCANCKYNFYCVGSCPSRAIVNGSTDLDCVLAKTSFEIAERITNFENFN
ncbi:MAG: radical SAM protein [Clostridia bacterium]